MSCSDIAIRVEDVSMRFEIYDKPRDQLKQFILPRLQSMAGLSAKQYFREFWALRNISFEVKKGESVGIIGRNGSGKSTLLQIITGTLTPTAGSVSTHGRIAALLELGSGFNPDFSGRENVYLNGALLGLSREQIDVKFDDIAAFADIGLHLDQPVKTYSSGMLVRLAFAVQVQVEPDILIVDEALAVGDALFQKRCFERIDKLVSDGTTLLFVSHDQESVRTLTSRALLLKEGKSKVWGLSSDVVLEYRRILHAEEKESHRAHLVRRQREISEEDILCAPTGKHRHQKFKSFGDLEAEIIEVNILDSSGASSNYFNIGDEVIFKIKFRANIELFGINVAFRIRNKEGIKVTSWGTLNDDMRKASDGFPKQNLFWSKKFIAGTITTVLFRMKCPLAGNFYELQTTVAKEQDMYYGSQEILHWKDEAAFFTISLKPKEYVVGGICDLGFNCEILSE
jgi:lipopolysaccharide transport system ATP-binding protein